MPIEVSLSFKITVVSAVQSRKQYGPIISRLAGIVTDLSDVHSRNVPYFATLVLLILVSVDGRETLSATVHLLKRS